MLPGTTAVLSLQSPPGTFLCPLASRLASLGSFPPWRSPKGQSSASVSELLPLLHTHTSAGWGGGSQKHIVGTTGAFSREGVKPLSEHWAPKPHAHASCLCGLRQVPDSPSFSVLIRKMGILIMRFALEGCGQVSGRSTGLWAL